MNSLRIPIKSDAFCNGFPQDPNKIKCILQGIPSGSQQNPMHLQAIPLGYLQIPMHFARDSLKGPANFEAMKMEDWLQTSLKHTPWRMQLLKGKGHENRGIAADIPKN